MSQDVFTSHSFCSSNFSNKTPDTEFIESLFLNSNNELLGASLRRANAFFYNKYGLICIYELWGCYFILGDVFFKNDIPRKEESVHREAIFQELLQLGIRNSKRILGYYLERPITSKQFKCYPLGFVHRRKISKDMTKGAQGEELRRLENLNERQDYLNFIDLSEYSDRSEDDKILVQKIYRSFIGKQLKPYIGYLLAKPSDPISNNEKVFLMKENKSEVFSALVTAFQAGSTLYVDRLVKLSPSRMSLDLLLGRVVQHCRQNDIKRLSLGLSPFYSMENHLFWKSFRRLISFWYKAENLKKFKNKFAKNKTQAYFFVEKRKSLFWNFLLLSFASVYWKIDSSN
ncbi:MAG: hypothetical protein VX642_11540 [Bdellovibrionota bacterium]|nr:hypothetical protein [Bdellovibrionota bacterium]